MTDTTISMANRVKQWDANAHKAYVRGNRFRKYMGTSENSIIQAKEDLTKKKGDQIVIPLLGALDASSGPNNGTTPLVGNEKALPNEGFGVKVKVVRDATVVNIEEEQASPIDIRNAGKVALQDLQKRFFRNDIITALGSVTGVPYATASAAQKNAWNALNSDRILFGNSVTNYNATHATALATITGAMTLTTDVVSEMKAIAQGASVGNSEGIRPFTYGDDEETFVMFVGAREFRQLKKNMAPTLAEAEKRGKENPLFTGTTSLYWDGVVIREIPEIKNVGAVGATGQLVAPVFLCGVQALAAVWAMRTKTTVRNEDDYGFKHGVGFQELRGVEKVLYGDAGKQWGMVSGFVASV